MLTDWIVAVVERLGGPGAGLIIALENVFPPIPSELVLPLVGFTASRGELTVAGAVAWTTIGSVVGALVLYGLGRRLGADRIHAAAARLPLVNVADVERTEAWFDRHGSKAVFFGRMIPLFRSLISVPAGIRAMPVPRFLLLTAAGSLLWNTGLITAGYLLGEQWGQVERYSDVVSRLLWIAAGLAVGWFVITRVRRRRTQKA